MNFFKHHIGDYDSHTAHLTWLEDMAYSRLLRLYYRNEQPIPADFNQVCRLIRATSKQEREAIQAVLNEFFIQEADGWHNKRCDEELAKANSISDNNRRIALEREENKRARKQHEACTKAARSVHAKSNEREPSQTPDTRHQTPDADAKQDSGTVVPINPEQQRLSDLNDNEFSRLVAELYAKVWELKSAPPVGLLLGSTICQRARSYGPACKPEWWEWYFEQCRSDKFLNGTKNPDFRADLTYLIREDVFAKVINAAHLEAAHG